MPRAGLDGERVVDAAAELLDREGPASLTLARVAKEVGVQAPSLYNHIDGLDDLRRRLGLRGLAMLGDACTAAVMGRAGPDALVELMHAYRRVAVEHPGLYALTQVVPEADDPEWERSSALILNAVLAMLSSYGIDSDDAIHAARSLRSALHGFALLETGNGFGLPQELDASFEFLVATIDRGLSGR